MLPPELMPPCYLNISEEAKINIARRTHFIRDWEVNKDWEIKGESSAFLEISFVCEIQVDDFEPSIIRCQYLRTIDILKNEISFYEDIRTKTPLRLSRISEDGIYLSPPSWLNAEIDSYLKQHILKRTETDFNYLFKKKYVEYIIETGNPVSYLSKIFKPNY